VVAIVIAVAILPDHHGIAIPVVALPDHFSIAIPITVTVAADRSNGHTARTDTDANLVRTGRHRTANSGHCDGYYRKTPDHRLLLCLCLCTIEEPIRTGLNGSGAKVDRRLRYGFIANQITTTTSTTTIAPQIAGVTLFELPLRGESLAA
jgi:hypothetical protein